MHGDVCQAIVTRECGSTDARYAFGNNDACQIVAIVERGITYARHGLALMYGRNHDIGIRAGSDTADTADTAADAAAEDAAAETEAAAE